MRLFTRINTSLIWIVIFLPFATFGQSNAPLGALPMQYNSSFAGSNGAPIISSFAGYETYKAQFPIPNPIEISNNTYRLYAAYDQFIPAIRTGIGFTASMSSQNHLYMSNYSKSDDRPRYASFALAIAPKFSIKGKYTISPSFDLTYTNTWNQTYMTYIDSALVSMDIVYHNLASRAAILFNSNKYYIGYSVNLVSKTFYRSNTLPISSDMNQYFNSYLQIGYTFGRSASKFSFIPQIVLQIHNYPYDNRLIIDLGAVNFNFRYKKFIWRFNNGGVHVGWQYDQLRVMLTNNFSFIDREPNYNSFNSSLSFHYLIPSNMQKKYTLPGM